MIRAAQRLKERIMRARLHMLRSFGERILRGADDSGPDSLVGVTEAGRAALGLLFCLAVALTLVAAFWYSS
jgi:hypothetical protein